MRLLSDFINLMIDFLKLWVLSFLAVMLYDISIDDLIIVYLYNTNYCMKPEFGCCNNLSCSTICPEELCNTCSFIISNTTIINYF